MTYETDLAVSQKLENLFITVTISHAGETTKENNWKCDAWRVNFKRGAQQAFKQFDTDYFTGTGHRKSSLSRPKYIAINPRSLAAEQWERNNMKPVKPSAASILHSLLSDGEAISTSFQYWCDDYGMDSDSIKAFNTYQACCETGKQINAFFSHSEREELKTLLQDY